MNDSSRTVCKYLKMETSVVSAQQFTALVEKVAVDIKAAPDFQPNTILALSTGGFPVAAALAKRLTISSRQVFGVPAYKDKVGDYHLDDHVLQLQRCDGLIFLVVGCEQSWTPDTQGSSNNRRTRQSRTKLRLGRI
jgi:hypothetical protein